MTAPIISVKQGNYVRLKATFYDADGILANPTSVTALLTLPDGTEVTPTLTSSSTGIWSTTYLVADDAPCGIAVFRPDGAGAVVAADDTTFHILKPKTPTEYE